MNFGKKKSVEVPSTLESQSRTILSECPEAMMPCGLYVRLKMTVGEFCGVSIKKHSDWHQGRRVVASGHVPQSNSVIPATTDD